MVRWIDIVSPRLRNIHRAWCDLRGRNLIPHLHDYNRFLPAAPERDSVCAVFPAQGRPPSFRNVGASLTPRFPDLRNGLAFSEIRSIVVRTTVTVPFHEVCASRQPDCRRGTLGMPAVGHPFEQLLIPFGDDRLRVCLVHAVFDFVPGR